MPNTSSRKNIFITGGDQIYKYVPKFKNALEKKVRFYNLSIQSSLHDQNLFFLHA